MDYIVLLYINMYCLILSLYPLCTTKLKDLNLLITLKIYSFQQDVPLSITLRLFNYLITFSWKYFQEKNMKLWVDRELKFHYLMKYRTFFFQGFLVWNTSPWIFYLANIKKRALICLLLQVHEMIIDERYCFGFANVYKLNSMYFSLHRKAQIKVIFNHIIVLSFASLYLYNDYIIIHVVVLGSEGSK